MLSEIIPVEPLYSREVTLVPVTVSCAGVIFPKQPAFDPIMLETEYKGAFVPPKVIAPNFITLPVPAFLSS